MSLIIWILIFLFSLFVLVKSSDYFTNSAEKIGLKIGFSPFVIGVTIVAIGTSLPELISSIFAVLSNSSEIVIGNVVGSNIANILLILGVAAIVAKKMETKYDLLRVDLPIFFSSALFIFMTCFDGKFTLWEGLIGLAGALTYLFFVSTSPLNGELSKEEIKKEKRELKKEGFSIQFFILILSASFLFFAAKFLIDSVVNVSEILNIGKEIIAITAVAIGTSLPELVVSLQAVRKGNSGMAFGNVLGSNIFNSFMVLGVSSFFGSLVIPSSVIVFSIPMMLGVSILFFFMIQDRILTRWEGIILLLAYLLFIIKIFGLG